MAVFLHTRIRVSDLDNSISFYSERLGFKLLSRSERSPHGNQIAHLELPGNLHTLELTYSDDYDLNVPEDLMHLAIGVPDLIAFCAELEEKGIEIWPEVGARCLPRAGRWPSSTTPTATKSNCSSGQKPSGAGPTYIGECADSKKGLSKSGYASVYGYVRDCGVV